MASRKSNDEFGNDESEFPDLSLAMSIPRSKRNSVAVQMLDMSKEDPVIADEGASQNVQVEKRQYEHPEENDEDGEPQSVVRSKKIRPFDKKNSVTFQMVNRSQQDPLIADERAPQNVLVEKMKYRHPERNDGRGTSQSVDRDVLTKRREEQRKFGVFFDDDYNYLQHLKDVQEVEPISGFDVTARPLLKPEKKEHKLNLPSSVFASNVEEKVGLLNRAAPIRGPQPQLDPDVMAALDDDFVCTGTEEEVVKYFEDLLEQGSSPDCSQHGSDEESDSDMDSGDDQLGSLDGKSQRSFEDEETRSRFTNYSMSSSVIRRGEGLTLLDDRFEKMFETYDEDQIGALDCDNIDGVIQPGDDLLQSVIQDYMKNKIKLELGDLRKLGPNRVGDGASSDEEETQEIIVEEPMEKWDCESILSTYSTLYNHPKLICVPSKPKPIKVSSKTGVPLGTLNEGLTASALKSLDSQVPRSSENSVISVCSLMRAKNETTEERRVRKQMVKEHRRERRMERKANTMAFKEEKKKQAVILSNVKEQLKGIKL